VIASAILLAIAVAIAVLGIRDSRPPELGVRMIGEPRVSAGVSYVTAEVHNSGTSPAEEVQVIAEVVQGGEPVPVGEQVVAFLSGGASARVVFLLDSPDLSSLTLRVESYTASR